MLRPRGARLAIAAVAAVLVACAQLPTIQRDIPVVNPQPPSSQSPAHQSRMTPRRALAAAELNGRIYVAGGWNGDATQLDLVEAFDPRINEWRPSIPMTRPRSQHALVAADGKLWAVAGWSASKGLVSEVETWSPGDLSWRAVTRLPTPRREPGVALLDRLIVVAGGFSGASDTDLDGYSNVVEAYDLDTRTWKTLAPLHQPRRGLSLVAIGDALYAIGGFESGTGFIGTIERYDPVENSWRTLNWRIEERTWTAAVADGNDIVIVGGFNGDGPLSLIERIQSRKGRVCRAGDLQTPRSWLAAVMYQGQLLTFGGESADGFSDAVEQRKVACM